MSRRAKIRCFSCATSLFVVANTVACASSSGGSASTSTGSSRATSTSGHESQPVSSHGGATASGGSPDAVTSTSNCPVFGVYYPLDGGSDGDFNCFNMAVCNLHTEYCAYQYAPASAMCGASCVPLANACLDAGGPAGFCSCVTAAAYLAGEPNCTVYDCGAIVAVGIDH
jgi:hypothetical protein